MAPKSRRSTGEDFARGEVLYLGIDLGTSRCAIAASNRRREWVESYVGWPKDFIARRALGKSIFFGSEALDHRMSLDLYRPFEHGVIKQGTARDDESVLALIAHLFELANPDGREQVHAAIGVPAEALKTNTTAIRDAVGRHANKLMIVSEPFSVAYGLGLLNDAVIIDIGAGTVDLCAMHGTMPGEDDQRTLWTAGDHIDEQLLALLSEQHPEVKFRIETVRQAKEEIAFVGESGGEFEIEVPVEGKLHGYDVTASMKRACESILPAIVETTMELIGRFDSNYQERLRSNIVLAGGGSQIGNIAPTLEAAFKEYGPSRVTCVKDPIFAGADGALDLAKDSPPRYWEDI